MQLAKQHLIISCEVKQQNTAVGYATYHMSKPVFTVIITPFIEYESGLYKMIMYLLFLSIFK